MLRDLLANAPPRVRPDSRELDFLHADVRLETFPATIRQATALERLVLASNPVRVLPSWIGELSKLRELMAGACELESLPDTIGQCTALEHLSLVANRLRTLPPSLAKLERLHTLLVARNQLQALPPLETLPSLRSLDLRSNLVTDLSRALPPALTELRLEDNPSLSRLPDAFANTHVRDLRLENLPALDWDGALAVLATAPSLESLTTCGHAPSPDALSALTRLRTLRVLGAGWTELPPALRALESLESLSLDQNALQGLPEWLFELPRLRAVYLFSNPVQPERLGDLRQRHPGVDIAA